MFNRLFTQQLFVFLYTKYSQSSISLCAVAVIIIIITMINGETRKTWREQSICCGELYVRVKFAKNYLKSCTSNSYILLTKKLKNAIKLVKSRKTIVFYVYFNKN